MPTNLSIKNAPDDVVLNAEFVTLDRQLEAATKPES